MIRRLLFICLLLPVFANADVIKNDTFTVASDTPLEDHTSDSGGGWQGGATTLTVEAATDAVVAEIGSTTLGLIGDENPSETDYFVEASGTLGGTGSGDRWGVVARGQDGASFSATADSYYFFRLTGDSGWTLWRVDAGTPASNIAVDNSYIADESIGTATEVKLKLQVEGTGATVTLNAWVDPDGLGYDQVVTDATDTHANRITTAGNPGVYLRETNVRILDFNAEDLVASSGEYDTAPLVMAQTTTAYTVTGSLDAAGDVDAVACLKDRNAPTIANVQAGLCVDAAGTGTEAAEATDSDSPSTGDFDFSLTLTPTDSFPVYDLYVTDGTTRTTLADEFLDPPSTCGEDSDELCEFTNITSIGTGSPCEDFNTAVNPDIASPDVLTSPVNVSPGDYALTIGADCQFSYDDSGEGNQQRAFNISIYDVSAEGTHASDIDFIANNTAPLENGAFDPVIVLEVDVAIAASDICAGFQDPDPLDTLEAAVTPGTLPNGLSLGGDGNCTLSGTPDTENESGVAITFTVTDDAEESDTLDITFYPIDTVTLPDYTTGDDTDAITAHQNAFPWQTEELTLTSTFGCDNVSDPAEASGEVISQDPVADTEVEPFEEVTIRVSTGSICAPGKGRQKKAVIPGVTISEAANDAAYLLSVGF